VDLTDPERSDSYGEFTQSFTIDCGATYAILTGDNLMGFVLASLKLMGITLKYASGTGSVASRRTILSSKMLLQMLTYILIKYPLAS
jgi:hypothetical protein